MGLLRLERTKNILREISGTLKSSATVRAAYGKPVKTPDRTIIPVAKVTYGFGGGGETEKGVEKGNRKAEREEGGGGGMMVRPVGVIEVTDKKTRYIPIGLRARLLFFLAAGFLSGWAFSQRRHAHHAHAER